MKFEFLVSIDVSHVEGKFASREDLEDKIKTELDNADPSTLTSDDDAEYSVESWTAELYTAPKPAPKPRRKAKPKTGRIPITSHEVDGPLPVVTLPPALASIIDPDIEF